MGNHKPKIFRKYVISFFAFCLLLTLIPLQTYAFSAQVIQRGATGDDVIELQARLQYIGYYTGKVDGVFGWSTYWAVRNYQHDFGIEVDGLVGDELKRKLKETTWFDKQYVHGKIEAGEKWGFQGKKGRGPQEEWPPPGQRDPGNLEQRKVAPPGPQQAVPVPKAPTPGAPVQPTPQAKQPEVGQLEESVNIPDGFSENDLRLMANAVYGESRGEPYEGQVAVAAVILNRVKKSDFPNTVSGVIFEPLAFTAVADGQIWLDPNETAKRAVMDAINGWDPIGGLVYYYNPATATSQWMFNRQVVLRIGKHTFVR